MTPVERYGVRMLRYLQLKSGEEPGTVAQTLKWWRSMEPAAIDRTYKAYNNLKTFLTRVSKDPNRDWRKPAGKTPPQDRRITRHQKKGQTQ